MGLNKVTIFLGVTFVLATSVRISTANPVDMTNPVGGAATLNMAMEDRLVTIKNCVGGCKENDDACAEKCTKDALPTDPAEREKLFLKAKESAKIQFCLKGCESVAVCHTLKQIEQQVDCAMSCTNFCGGLVPLKKP